MKKCVTLLLAAVLAVGSAFSSQAGSAFKKKFPLPCIWISITGRLPFMTDILPILWETGHLKKIHLPLQKF